MTIFARPDTINLRKNKKDMTPADVVAAEQDVANTAGDTQEALNALESMDLRAYRRKNAAVEEVNPIKETILENSDLVKKAIANDPNIDLNTKVKASSALDNTRALSNSADRLKMAAAAPEEVQAEIQKNPPSAKDQFMDALVFFSPQIIGGLVGSLASNSDEGALMGMDKGAQLRDSYLKNVNDKAAAEAKAKSDAEKMALEKQQVEFGEEKDLAAAERADRALDLQEREMNQKFQLMKQEQVAKASKTDLGRDLPAATINLLSEGKVLPKLLKTIPSLIEKNKDLFGPVKGRYYENNPYSAQAKAVQAELKAKSQAFGRYMEGGVLRKEDEEKYTKMFPTLTDLPEVANKKLAIINKLLSDKQNEYVSGYKQQGYNADAFQLDESPSIDSNDLNARASNILSRLNASKGSR